MLNGIGRFELAHNSRERILSGCCSPNTTGILKCIKLLRPAFVTSLLTPRAEAFAFQVRLGNAFSISQILGGSKPSRGFAPDFLPRVRVKPDVK